MRIFSSVDTRSTTNNAIHEDKHFSDNELHTYAVMDGLSNHDQGHLASEFVRHKIQQYYLELRGNTKQQVTQLDTMIHKINRELRADNNRQHMISKSTLTLCKINPDGEGYTGIFANLGDSRAYIYRERTLYQITTDDNLLTATSNKREFPNINLLHFTNEQLTKIRQRLDEVDNADELIMEEFWFYMHRHVLVNTLGDAEIKVNILTSDLESNDKILLLTDGITDNLTNSQIRQLCSRHNSPHNLAQDLVYEAGSHSHKDNRYLFTRSNKSDMTALVIMLTL